MDAVELQKLFRSIESSRVERKSSGSAKEEIRKAICAFGNDLPDQRLPGFIFIGVKDDGTCAGLSVDDQLLRELGGYRELVTPFPRMNVERHIIDGCELAVVEVLPSDSTPLRYDGRVWIRVGPRRAVASPEEERRLVEKRRAGDLPFDIRPLTSAALDDLDVDLFKSTYLPQSVAADVLALNRRTVEQQLAALRLATAGNPPLPTVLGLLIVGKDPGSWVSGANVQFLRIDGKELGEPVKHGPPPIAGPMAEMLRDVERLVQTHISTAVDFTSGPSEVRRPDYPIEALRQLLRNAVMHRNYEGTNAPIRITWFDDRIEIANPGGPFGQVTVGNFGTPGITDYRNPHLAEAMRNMGFVQKFGVGIATARRLLAENGNPPPEFKVEPTNVLVTIRRRP